jgi:hypothetical protein
MSAKYLPSQNDGPIIVRPPVPVKASWSAFIPIGAASVAVVAWVVVLAAQLMASFDWSRAMIAIGLLLPVCALAPFSALFKKKLPAPVSAPVPVEVRQPAQPPRLFHLENAPLDSIPAVLPLWRLFDRIARTGRTDYPVVDEAGHLIGVIAHGDLPSHDARPVLGWLVAADVMRPPRSAA